VRKESEALHAVYQSQLLKDGNRGIAAEANFSEHVAMSCAFRVSFILGERQIFGVPLPSRSMGMMELAENLQIIYGAQQFRGKILSRKDLGLIAL
jgi:hypothetical protein